MADKAHSKLGGLSTRAYNCLENLYFNQVGSPPPPPDDIEALRHFAKFVTYRDLARARNCGKVAIACIFTFAGRASELEVERHRLRHCPTCTCMKEVGKL